VTEKGITKWNGCDLALPYGPLVWEVWEFFMTVREIVVVVCGTPF